MSEDQFRGHEQETGGGCVQLEAGIIGEYCVEGNDLGRWSL